jgi:ribosome-associated protein
MSDQFEEEYEEKSKSQIKRELLALQDLGAQLAGLKPEMLNRLPINDALRKALDESPRHTKHIARKRHNQYLGKLLRDHDVDAIMAVLDQFDTASREYNNRFHQLERWRERLLDEGDDALQELMQEYPDIDSQHLRGLIRQARQERAREKPPAAARKLFRYLREVAEKNL